MNLMHKFLKGCAWRISAILLASAVVLGGCGGGGSSGNTVNTVSGGQRALPERP